MTSVEETSQTVRVKLRGLTKVYTRESGEKTTAVDRIDLDIFAGEFLVLLGPSGCGKTTLLRSIAGLELPDSGIVQVNESTLFDSTGKKATIVPVERRPISMVFQSYALWPHMSVQENIAYPLKSKKVANQEIQDRVARVIEAAGIQGLEKQYPTQLSGGQQQRVALARAVVSANDLVLFDEPLSNVDAKVRDQLRIEILRMQKELGFTAIYVTHDQDEAMMLGHRIAVLDSGKVSQLDTPREIYEKPVNPYVARFVGTVDEFSGSVTSYDHDSQMVWVTTDDGLKFKARCESELSGKVQLMARPERWKISTSPMDGANVLTGEVRASMYMAGSRTQFLVRTSQGLIRVWSPHGVAAKEGDQVWVQVLPEDLLIFGDES